MEESKEKQKGSHLSQIRNLNRFLQSLQIDETSLSIKDLSQNFETLINRCKKVYSEHLLDEAYRLMIGCRQLEPIVKKYTERILSNEEILLFQTVDSEYIQMQEMLIEMENIQGWTTDRLGSSAKVSHKHNLKTEMLYLKVEIDFDVPIQVMLTLLYEINYWSLWMPFVKKTRELSKVQRNALIYELEFGLPYPLNNRRTVLFGKGANRLYENGTILIVSKSILKDADFLEKHNLKINQNSGFVNMDFHFGGFELAPLGTDKCRIKGIAKIDPKIKWIPDAMLNILFKKGIQFGMDKLTKRAKNFKGSVWEKEANSKEKKDFYECFNKMIEDYIREQNGSQLLPKL